MSTAMEVIVARAGITAEAGIEDVDGAPVVLVSNQPVGLLVGNTTVGWAGAVDIFRGQWFPLNCPFCVLVIDSFCGGRAVRELQTT